MTKEGRKGYERKQKGKRATNRKRNSNEGVLMDNKRVTEGQQKANRRATKGQSKGNETVTTG